MDSAILSTTYLGPIEYYSKLFHYKNILLETQENYIKQTYRNRCFIGAANDKLSLSIPVESSGGEKTSIKEIRLSDHGNWRHQHWYAIRSTYNSTPFFEYYEDEFAPFFEKKFDFLFDLNEELRELICSLLGISPNIIYTNEYFEPNEDFRKPVDDIIYKNELIIPSNSIKAVQNNSFLIKDITNNIDESIIVKDFRYTIHPKRDYKILDNEYKDVDYYQLFDKKWGFRPNLSIIDLLFNMGNESIIILKNSIK